MNRKVLALVVVVALAGTMMLPSAAAVHGSRYMAVGIAFKHDGMLTPPLAWLGPTMVPADEEIYRVTVLWTGYNPPPGMPFNSYQVRIYDIATGERVVDDIFAGAEFWGCCVYGNTEVFQYHGCAAVRSGWSGTCVDNPDFDVYGLQVIHVPTQQQNMLYSGWYNDWGMYLLVEGHVDDILA